MKEFVIDLSLQEISKNLALFAAIQFCFIFAAIYLLLSSRNACHLPPLSIKQSHNSVM